jgi:hypothetical protein
MQIDLILETSLNAPSVDIRFGSGSPQTANMAVVHNWFKRRGIIFASEKGSIDTKSQNENQEDKDVAFMDMHIELQNCVKKRCFEQHKQVVHTTSIETKNTHELLSKRHLTSLSSEHDLWSHD